MRWAHVVLMVAPMNMYNEGRSLHNLKDNSLKKEVLQLSDVLPEYHDIVSLCDDERGETDLVEFKIDTGDASP